MPDVKPFPKPDLSKYPEIPAGACLNFNNRYGYYQVYKSFQRRSVYGEEAPEQDHVWFYRTRRLFSPSPTWLLSKKNDELLVRLGEKDTTTEKLLKGAAEAAAKAANESAADTRRQSKVVHRLEPLLLGTLLRSLSGRSDASSVSDAINGRLKAELFDPFLPGMLAQVPVSHDTVRKVMLLADPEKFASMCQKFTAGLASELEGRVIAADGQAVKASRSTGENGGAAYMIMNFYDTVGRVCIGQKLIDRKTNEITAGPEILKNLDVRGATITTDALSCQAGFAEKVIQSGAHYLFALKGNQDRMSDEALSLFTLYEGPGFIA